MAKFYHAVISMKDRCATIRPSNHGVTEVEWLHGCRTYGVDVSPLELELDLKRKKMYDVLNLNQWRDYISSLDEPSNVPNNNFVSTRVVYDKWDSNRPIH